MNFVGTIRHIISNPHLLDANTFDEIGALRTELIQEIKQAHPEDRKQLAEYYINDIEKVSAELLNLINAISAGMKSIETFEELEEEDELQMRLQSLGHEIDETMSRIIEKCLIYIKPLSPEFIKYAKGYVNPNGTEFQLAQERMKTKQSPGAKTLILENVVSERELEKLKPLLLNANLINDSWKWLGKFPMPAAILVKSLSNWGYSRRDLKDNEVQAILLNTFIVKCSISTIQHANPEPTLENFITHLSPKS
jgi:hypothetical protein